MGNTVTCRACRPVHTAPRGLAVVVSIVALCVAVAIGPAVASVAEGKKLLAAGKVEEALQVLMPLAREGDAEAQYLIGKHHHSLWLSHGTPRKDLARAWLEKSAAQNYPLRWGCLAGCCG